MLHSGLVSISFRSLSPEEIVALATQARLEGIEWGGDVHVPHGDVTRAAAVRRLSRAAGLRVSAYGSYYRAGEPAGAENPDFAAVLASARELGAPVIRIWAGRKGSAAVDAAEREAVVADLERIGRMARAEGIVVACEFHANTLTDTNESALALYDAVTCDTVRAYWQPPVDRSPEYCLEGLRALLPRLCNLHVFYWTTANGRRERRPLAEGEEYWAPFFEAVAATGRDHWAMLEFVRDDAPEQLLDDAAVLNRWLAAFQA